MRRPTLLTLATCALTVLATAQRDLEPAGMETPASGNFLLWLPGDYATLRDGADFGYVVRRQPVLVRATGRALDLPPRTIHVVPPQDSATWEARAAGNDSDALIYGAVFDGEADMTFGGAPTLVDLAEREGQREARHLLAVMALAADYTLAQRFGVGYVDRDASADTSYVYHVHIDGPTSARRARTAIRPRPTSELHSELKTEAIEVDGPSVRLFFSYDRERLPYAAFTVERRRAGTTDWAPVRDRPSVPVASADGNTYAMVDSLPDCEHAYEYRIYADGPFNKWLRTRVTFRDEVDCAFEPEPITPEIIDIFSHVNRYVADVKVKLPDSVLTRIQEVVLEQSERDDIGFAPVASAAPADSVILQADKLPPEVYFRVRVLTNDGYAYTSITHFHQPLDTEPPAAVTNVRAAWRGRGDLTLTWDANTEPDLLGYRVFRANWCGEHFAEMTTDVLRQPRFETHIDLEGVENRDIYFAVVPVDLRYNQDSVKPCQRFRRPDIMPPAAGRIVRTRDLPDGFSLELNTSVSADAARYRVFRRTVSGAHYGRDERLFEVAHAPSAPDGRQLLVDTTTQAGVTYRYRVLTFDSTGNASASPVFQAVGNGGRGRSYDAPVVRSVVVDARAGAAYVTFAYDDTLALQGFEVYRATPGQPLRLHEVVAAGQVRRAVSTPGTPVSLTGHVSPAGTRAASTLIYRAGGWDYRDADADCAALAANLPPGTTPAFTYALVAVHAARTSPQSDLVTGDCP